MADRAPREVSGGRGPSTAVGHIAVVFRAVTLIACNAVNAVRSGHAPTRMQDCELATVELGRL